MGPVIGNISVIAFVVDGDCPVPGYGQGKKKLF